MNGRKEFRRGSVSQIVSSAYARKVISITEVGHTETVTAIFTLLVLRFAPDNDCVPIWKYDEVESIERKIQEAEK